jgi:16S rRNA (cytidine1402-2'-O)-methyltransferase
MPGTLFVVATPIGNLEDVTARAIRVLRESALIAAEDTRRTAHLLARYGITTPTTSLHEHNEFRKTGSLIDRLQDGQHIALVSDAGTPAVSDPGQRLISAAIDAGIRVEPIPGPSAVLAALTVSGLPTDTFAFLGFPPTRSKDRNEWLESVRTSGRTVVFFEAPHRVRSTLEQLLKTVGDCRTFLGRELTKAHEELVRGPISDVLLKLGQPRGEYTVVLDIGRMANITAVELPEASDIATEFGVLTKYESLTRRQAVSTLARRHGLSSKEVYSLIENAKKSVK